MARFRLTDEQRWTHEFDATDAVALAEGIRAAWYARIATTRAPGGVHPRLALSVRLGEIRAWLAPRMARTDATDEQRRSWESQAQHWMYTARRDLGGEIDSPLRLHVQGAEGTWLTLCQRGPRGDWRCDPYAPRVSASEPTDRIAELCGGAEAMLAHERNLLGLADSIPEMIRTVTHPKPRGL